MAHRTGKASTKLGRDSQPKYLGIKLFDGQKVKIGNIIARQRGAKYIAGANVRKGSDDTLYALANGTVKFKTFKKTTFTGTRKVAKKISIIA